MRLALCRFCVQHLHQRFYPIGFVDGSHVFVRVARQVRESGSRQFLGLNAGRAASCQLVDQPLDGTGFGDGFTVVGIGR